MTSLDEGQQGGTATFRGSQIASTDCALDTSSRAVLPSANQKLYDYTVSRLGQKVGSGQCADLPNQGLINIGAKTFYQINPNQTGAGADYEWGTLVTTLSKSNRALAQLRAGDVLQLRDVLVKNDQSSFTASHHTMVVRKVLADSNQLCIFHQNAGGVLKVEAFSFSSADIQQGTIKAYRPRY